MSKKLQGGQFDPPPPGLNRVNTMPLYLHKIAQGAANNFFPIIFVKKGKLRLLASLEA